MVKQVHDNERDEQKSQQMKNKYKLLLECAQEAVDDTRAFYDAQDDDEITEPSWLAELESAIEGVEK